MIHDQGFYSWVFSVIGSKLVSVSGLFHFHFSKRNKFADEISFVFDNSIFAKFYGASDGATLCFSLDKMLACDLEEYGETVVYCLSEESPFADVVGRELNSVNIVKSLIEEAYIGIVFNFDGGKQLYLLNLGDELFFYTQLPKEILLGEKLTFIPIVPSKCPNK